MKEIEVVKYHPDYKEQWNAFLANAKNATFLFNRDFMDYHADRFDDFSLLFFDQHELVALLPANITAGEVHSHQGLSYGGIVLKKEVTFEEVVEILKNMLIFLETEGIRKLTLKLLPTIYNSLPSDEIDYLVFILNAKLTRRDTACVIDYSNRLPVTSSNRIRGLKRARKNNLEIREDQNFDGFWNEVLIPNLLQTHQSVPVHTVDEIRLLHSRFPENIRQFNVYGDDQIVGGTTIFEMADVAHVQYISANEIGRTNSALDLLYDYLIDYFRTKKYFTFGISNEDQGRKVNKGLLHWKETFGGRVIVHSFYEIETKNHPFLKTIFI